MTIASAKGFDYASCKVVDADADALALVNRYALVPQTAADVVIRKMYLAHNAIDRDDEAFDNELLTCFARTLPGKGVFVKHPSGWNGDGGPGLGLFIKCDIIEMSHAEACKLLETPLMFPDNHKTARILDATFFILKTSDSEDLIKRIDAGVARFTSIGFSAASRDDASTSTGTIFRLIKGPGEAREGSFVWLGAQPGAGIHKGADDAPKPTSISEKGNNTMTEEELKRFNEFKHLASEAESKAATAERELSSIKTALGDHVQDIPALLKTAEMGVQHKTSLIEDVIAAERLAGLLGDGEDQVGQQKALLSNASLDFLKSRLKALQASQPQDIEHADHNKGRAKTASALSVAI